MTLVALPLLASLALAAAPEPAAGAVATPTAPVEKPRLLVLDLGANLGADAELAKVLTSLMVTQLTQTELYAVSSVQDIQTMLGVEQQKQLVGCGDDSCMAELGGALGAGWVVSGSISSFGSSTVLTLRLINSKESRLEHQMNKTLPAEREELPEAMRVAAYQLLRLPVPPRADDDPWYTSPWLWVGVGLGAVGLGVGGYFLFSPPGVPEGALGNVVIDAP